jgi:uncharacterized membrane protein YciS (DUF1049 family)
MLKVVIDFLLSQGDIIISTPVPFIIIFMIGFALGWLVNSWSQKNRLETNEERLKLNQTRLEQSQEEIKERDAEIQSIKQQLATQGEVKDHYHYPPLSENEIRALKAISIFQKKNSCQEPKFPAEYSVDNLIKDLQIDGSEANEILKNLRGLKLFESVYDNMTKYTNIAQPINETPPGRLSKKGQDFVNNHKG